MWSFNDIAKNNYITTCFYDKHSRAYVHVIIMVSTGSCTCRCVRTLILMKGVQTVL